MMNSSLRRDWERFLERLRIRLRPAQQELIDNLFNFPRTADITWARDTGKSFVLGLFSLFLAYRLSLRIIVGAPKLSQTDAIIEWAHWAAAKILKRGRLHYDNRYELAIRGRGSITGLSGSVTAHIQSKHGHVVIIDEKQDMPATVVSESFLGMIANLDGCLWLTGVGGDPSSAGELIGKTSEFIHKYPWQEHIKHFPKYINTVNKARETMLPEEFQAHYECKPLDISTKLLVPSIRAYTEELNPKDYRVTAGVDWGARLDRSIVTVLFKSNEEVPHYYLDDWFVCYGNYAQQIKDITYYLEHKDYDQVYSESNGVGDASSDFLAEAIEGTTPINVNAQWKTSKAHEIYRMTQDGTMKYNSTREVSGAFHKDITALGYKFTPAREIQVDHSDFISSLMLAMEDKRTLFL